MSAEVRQSTDRSEMTVKATRLARSPPAWPPMPSATAHVNGAVGAKSIVTSDPSRVWLSHPATRMASSLRLRTRPRSVNARTLITDNPHHPLSIDQLSPLIVPDHGGNRSTCHDLWGRAKRRGTGFWGERSDGGRASGGASGATGTNMRRVRTRKRRPPFRMSAALRLDSDHLMILVTRPAPTVLPPSRIANRRPSSIATGWISLTAMSTLSPGMTMSVPRGRVTTPVTSVVRK